MQSSLSSDSGLIESHYNPLPKAEKEKALHIDATANVTITEIKVGSSKTFSRRLTERMRSNEKSSQIQH